MREQNGSFYDWYSHLLGVDGCRSRLRTENIKHKINVSLEDLYNGKEVTLCLTRNIVCPDCKGKGCLPGTGPMKCSDCGGSGQKVSLVRMGPMITQQIGTCPTCHGVGEQIDSKDKCKRCNGKKVFKEKKTIVVHIEPGMEDGDKILFTGCSDETPGFEAGDLIICLKLKKHDYFQRKHNDLLMCKKISLSEALLGTNSVLTHLDGRNIVISMPVDQLITPNSVKVIEGEGMPLRGNQFDKGRLFVKFEIIFPNPEQLTPQFKESITKFLPLPNECAGINLDDDNVYQVGLKESDLKQFENSKSTYSNHRDEAYNTERDEEESQDDSCQPM